MNLDNEFYNNKIRCEDISMVALTGMVDRSYFDGSRLEAIARFKENMSNFVFEGDEFNTTVLIRDEDWDLPRSILENVREIILEDEAYLLFWALHTNYDEKKDHYVVYYPVTQSGSRDSAEEYIVDKVAFNLFFFCNMYNLAADNSTYFRMKMMRANVPYIASPPPSVCSIKSDGQMKILTDVVEMVQDISFEDGDKVLVLGSSSEEGVCSGMSYRIISYMTDKKISVDLYDPEDIEMNYDIGTVSYKHHKEKYIYDGTESQYKLLFDDIWVKGEYRSWDQSNHFAKVPFFSIKWFPEMDPSRQPPHAILKSQRYYTKGAEQRLVSNKPNVIFKREDKLGSCSKCNWFKYVLNESYSIEFYDFIMKMHNVHCITKEIRHWFGPDEENVKLIWYGVSDMELSKEWRSTAWDKIVGYPVIFVNDQTVKGQKFVFSDRKNVRSLIYNSSLVFVKEYDGKCYTNKQDIKDLIYSHYSESSDINLVVARYQMSTGNRVRNDAKINGGRMRDRVAEGRAVKKKVK
jgi:hypothetical protein